MITLTDLPERLSLLREGIQLHDSVNEQIV